ncbi:hypothetical protein ASE61_14925 [Bosea sp. Root670]|uniref:hypothetical protein n=1 Tax=Bosea sp. Root670 TaxID=1736583 RepID=UPI00071283EB|nr:hypothetical protein [Bosea sp. Root670]KRE02571.1 hypothetical protein ASE61_14925 [Bosea sp. Root670]
MNDAFRRYAFGRSFNLNLSEKHVETLSLLCKGDMIASLGLGGTQIHGLERRGLVVMDVSEEGQRRFRPTKAGLLVYDLLVEAGEYAALEVTRRETLELEDELHKREWEERFGRIKITLRERYRRDPIKGEPA